jgi:spermidine synthase
VTGDARTSVAELPSDAYDLVVGDAFGSVSVPWHLTTTEFVGEVERVLRLDGVYVMNVIDRGPLDLLRAEVATVQETFPHVAVLHRPGVLAGSGGNFVVVASRVELPVEELRARAAEQADPAVVLSGDELQDLVGDVAVLTDDFAPVDQLLTT